MWIGLLEVSGMKGEGEMGVTLLCLRASARCCAPCSPIWLFSRPSTESVYVKWFVRSEWYEAARRDGCYIVLSERVSKMLYSLFADLVVIDAECCECLCEMMCRKWLIWREAERWMLHYFVWARQQDVVLLVGRFDCPGGRVLWVSVWNDVWEVTDMKRGRAMDVTLLCLRASARCCAPCSPIWLFSRSSTESVYVKWFVRSEWYEGRRRDGCYTVMFESIIKMLCSSFADLVVFEVEYWECLCEMIC
jgi:hypothetical protein